MADVHILPSVKGAHRRIDRDVPVPDVGEKLAQDI
jgi:hypothetical protein